MAPAPWAARFASYRAARISMEVSLMTSTFGMNYERPWFTGNGWMLNLHVDGSYRSDTQSTFNKTMQFGRNFYTIEKFWIANASVDIDAGPWNVGLFVRNIFNEDGITGGAPNSFVGNRSQYFYVTRPVTGAFSLRYSYE
jgi:iron complex outermembrane receptor protein